MAPEAARSTTTNTAVTVSRGKIEGSLKAKNVRPTMRDFPALLSTKNREKILASGETRELIETSTLTTALDLAARETIGSRNSLSISTPTDLFRTPRRPRVAPPLTRFTKTF
jgi:hypothetical protein